jgi:hypothetical protein
MQNQRGTCKGRGRGCSLLRITGTSPSSRPAAGQQDRQPSFHSHCHRHPHTPTWATMSRVTEVAPALANSAARSVREACRGVQGALN